MFFFFKHMRTLRSKLYIVGPVLHLNTNTSLFEMDKKKGGGRERHQEEQLSLRSPPALPHFIRLSSRLALP